ncbi:MAG: right-handed parallel beta-helix repeat-containing protein [Luteimonas sp.]
MSLAALPALGCEPVTSVPATLSHGVYCLTDDVVATDTRTLFTLNNNATIDCQGHTVRDGRVQILYAVYSEADNIEVRNCRFEGFATPVYLRDATHFRIIGNEFVDVWNSAIYTYASEGLISGNSVSNGAGPQPAGYPYYWYGPQATSIHADYGTVDIVGNTIVDAVSGNGSRWTYRSGIRSNESAGGVVAYNVVRGLVPGQGHSRMGILVTGDGSVGYRNVVSLPAISRQAGADDTGFGCEPFSSGGGIGSVSVENIVVGAAVPYLYCWNTAEVGLKARVPRR